MTFGEKLLKLRSDAGFSQDKLAEMLDVSRQSVSKWERDLSYPDITTIPKLADILGVSADELLKCRTESKETDKKENLPLLITRAIALAMGCAVTVLSITGKIEIKSGFTLLGIGLACLAISLFIDQKD